MMSKKGVWQLVAVLVHVVAVHPIESPMSTSTNIEYVDLIKEVFGHTLEPRMCPKSGEEDAAACQETDPDLSPHKIVQCQELRLGGGYKNQTFSCKCRYLKANANCDLINRKPEYEPVHDQCLFVYVGMAVQGHNDLFHQWTDKETCFNLCLKTTVRNGAKFNCQSFEHWHRDCPEAAATNTTELAGVVGEAGSKTCASFNMVEDDDETSKRAKNQRSPAKLGFCVLSNQTMRGAGGLFAPNNKVTYYELLCKRPDESMMPVSKPPVRTVKPSRPNPQPRTKQKSATKQISMNDHFKPSATNKPTPEMKISTWEYEPTTSTSNLRCAFNPCSNGGSCLLIDRDRFTCKCKELYHGVYCDDETIQKKCLKTYMELIINDAELANQFQIQITDLYINDKIAAVDHSSCRLRQTNRTHSRFKIPYQKCSTLQTSTEYENIYTVNLYSHRELKPISGAKWPPQVGNSSHQEDDGGLYLLSSYECRHEKQQVSSPNTTEIIIPFDGSSSHAALGNLNSYNEKVAKSTNPCILDLLNLKLSVFSDKYYQKEISAPEFAMSSRARATFDRKLYVQLFVQYSPQHSDLFTKLEDKLKFIHLTLRRCYLTRTQNEKTHLLQLLIEHGCARKEVKFESIPNSKSSIQFWFEFSAKVKVEKPTSVYLHCFPEICTDIQPSKSASKEDNHFYSQFKLCEKLSRQCDTKVTTTQPPTTTSASEEEDEKPLNNFASNDYETAQSRPIEPNYNRHPLMIPRPRWKFRGGGSSSGDYLDDSDFSRFQPQRVEEERIFRQRRSLSSISTVCNQKFTYGPIYLEDRFSLDDDLDDDQAAANFGLVRESFAPSRSASQSRVLFAFSSLLSINLIIFL